MNFVYLFERILIGMQALDVNRKLIDGYLELFKNLSSSNKRELISRLTDSLSTEVKLAKPSLRSLFNDFIPEKDADTLIDELKKSRNFTRNIEPF